MGYRFTESKQTVRYSRIDEIMYNDLAEEATIIGETTDALSKNEHKSQHLHRDHVQAIQFDTYNALNKYNPQRTDGGDPLTNEIMDRVQADEKYSELRKYTTGNDLSSALGASGLTQQVIYNLPQEVKDSANNAHKAQEEADQAKGDMLAHEDPQAPGTPDEETDYEEYKELADFYARKQAQADQAKATLADSIKGHGKAIAHAVSRGMKDACGSAGAMNAASQAFGMSNSEIGGGLSLEEKFRIAKIIQNQGPKFAKIIDLIGRARITAEKKNAEKNTGSGEIVDLTEGSDIGLLLDDEIAMLRNPVLGKMKRAQLLDDALAQFEVEHKEPESRGDIIALVDESGSMSGQPDAEAKAIVLALAHIALKQGRKLKVMFFQTSVTATYDLDGTSKAVDIALRTLGEIARRGTGGGTNFDQPMRAAVDASNDMNKPDVLVITDGQASITDSTMQAIEESKRENGLNIYTMLIGSAGHQKAQVLKFSDRVWDCNSLLDDAANDVFEILV